MLPSRCDGLNQEMDNMVQEVDMDAAVPDTVHTAPSLRVERETTEKTHSVGTEA